MKCVERYITKSVLSSIAMITIALAGLQLFILFIAQINDLGRGDFSVLEALIVVLLQLPYQIYLFFPIISLLGSLVGLGILAEHRELVIMQASGMSIFQIALAVLKTAFIIIILVTLIGETVAPKMVLNANNRKMQDISGGQALRTAEGVWVRYHEDFIFISAIDSENTLTGVFQFRFNPAHELVMSRKVSQIVRKEGRWEAENIQETDISESGTKVVDIPYAVWDAEVNPTLLKLSANQPDEMTLDELHRYIREARRNNQANIRTQVAYFQRLLQPLATLVMMLLAIPFIFGPLRSTTMGSKFLLGVSVGFSFYILNRIFGLLGPMIQLPSILVAPTPIILFALLGFYFMRKGR